MRAELIIKTRSLAGSSDLTLLAPIKPGLVPSLESVTYKTRIYYLLATLSAGRSSLREYELLRPFSDSVERVDRIHSVRVAIVEPEQLLLSVTFDGGIESYLRVLWQKVGTLLDVIFCNTEGYVTAWDHSFEEWADWVQKVQIETDFFYGMPELTVDDVPYMRHEELLYRQKPGGNTTDLTAARQSVHSVEEETWTLVRKGITPVTSELGRQGLRALAYVYRLADYYLPGSTDGEILRRATRDLLLEFVELAENNQLETVIKLGKIRFDEQIRWLLKSSDERSVPALPQKTPQPDVLNDVQCGIISPYPENITHGCLVLIAFGNRKAAAEFLDAVTDHWITPEGITPAPGKPAVNIAFTCEGLRAMGLLEAEINLFPLEFREGMEARASVLGDLRTNHPRRWRMPLRNFDSRTAKPANNPPLAIELSSVHAVLQLRIDSGPISYGEGLEEKDPLFALVTQLRNQHPQVEFLSVQPMVRYPYRDCPTLTQEHFGFVDGLSQPVLNPAENGKIYNRNQIQLGELLMGYANQSEAPPDVDRAPDPDLARDRRSWLHNGSFLVVRKLRQDVEALTDAVNAAHAETGLDRELIYAKLVGRWRCGKALAGPGMGNDFDYVGEVPPGSLCPFHAHIRRANPRQRDDPAMPPPPPGARTPRLMRRGMSYGPRYEEKDRDTWGKPRGMVFMVYNASIAEQFEVVQRWVSGGNSSGGFSGQSDPLFGVAQIGERRFYRFEHENKVYRIALDGSEIPLEDPRPFVLLEWGAYLFTPSIKALNKLAQTAQDRADDLDEPAWSVPDGWRRIQELFNLERREGAEWAKLAWKALLEDPEAEQKFQSAGVWAAIRQKCGGVFRTPYGVIVANRHLIGQVLNPERRYSVRGYHDRMSQSIGEIYLGLDDEGQGCPYRERSTEINRAIGNLSMDNTFTRTRAAARGTLSALINAEKQMAQVMRASHWQLDFDVKEVVDKTLAALCQQWCGLPSEPCEIQPGGARWDWKPGDPPFYPGHFTAPSRYFFQPEPGQSVKQLGDLYGKALTKAFGCLIRRHRDSPGRPPVLDASAPLAKAVLSACPRSMQGGDEPAARSMVGVMMGFLPTIDGNVLRSLNEWLNDGSFWSLRTALKDCGPAASFAQVRKLLEPPLIKSMQLRPTPELIWRTATRDDRIGHEEIHQGDRVVLAIVSATQDALAQGDRDVWPIFGGVRSGAADHPTHACPGYEAAMGALLGIMTALLEVDESMRPSVAPLALTVDGYFPPAQSPGLMARGNLQTFDSAAQGGVPESDQIPQFGAGHRLVADGDSWMAYRSLGIVIPQNIAEYLKTYGFIVDNDNASDGTRLFDFYDDNRDNLTCKKPAASSSRLDQLCAKVKDMVIRGTPPTAILLSAAGDDVVDERLTPLLNDQAAGPPALNEEAVAATLNGLMRCWLEAILDRIMAECRTAQGDPIPVFIHGYDFPVPDSRYLAGVVSKDVAWLWPYIHARGYQDPTYPEYPIAGVSIMQTLIQRLNDMQAKVVALPRFTGHVFHVKLTGTLSNAKVTYTTLWENELHANKSGFVLLTKVFADALAANIPALTGNIRALKAQS